MRIKLLNSYNDEYGFEELVGQEMQLIGDNGNVIDRISQYQLNECPEDAIFGRRLNAPENYISFIKEILKYHNLPNIEIETVREED